MTDIPQQILKWSAARPLWQRDALRRLFERGKLDSAAYDELVNICKQDNGVATAAPMVTAVPLDAAHLSAASTGSPVTLASVKDVTNVNALAPHLELPFGPSGVTVIYGDNGSGKSGYARILKRACRARGERSKIIPDIFAASNTGVPTATIGYLDGASIQAYQWTDAASQPPSALSHVSVFDSETASFYVEEKTDIAFLPHGLDVFPKLVAACERVRTTLQAEIAHAGPYKAFPELMGEDPVGDAMRGMLEEGGDARLAALASLTVGDLARLAELSVLIRELDANNASAKASAIRLRKKRYEELAIRLKKYHEQLGPNGLATLRTLYDAYTTASKVATAAQEIVFSGDNLFAVGSSEWRALWEAARRYGAKIYPDHEHPFTREGSQCLLCQQQLSAEAANRLAGFEAFVKQDTQRQQQIAAAALGVHVDGLKPIVANQADFETVLEELGGDDAAAAEAVRVILRGVPNCRDTQLNAATAGDWHTAVSLDNPPLVEIAAACAVLDAEAQRLIEADNVDAHSALRHEYAALLARQKLRNELPSIGTERTRALAVAALQKCIEQTNTTGITAKNTELTKKGVSADLRAGFQAELDSLRLDHLTVSVEPTEGAKGVTYHRVGFSRKTVPGSWDIQDVLSEGEHRCIALAGFLAELATQDPMSGVLFDDPVSSLDHVRREVVADRLVEEAKRRQVIIFTHDIVFLLHLREQCDIEDVKLSALFLSRSSTHMGVPSNGLPWVGMKLTDRITWLRSAADELKKKPFATTEEYALQAAPIWGRLRDAWEQGVEEVLLNGAVKRFSMVVSTKPLEKIGDITDADLQAVKIGMTESSKWLPGHNQPGAMNAPMPSPAVLAKAVDDLATWRTTIIKRREKKP